MKKLFVAIFLLIAATLNAQTVVNRAASVNTVSDSRLQAAKNLFLPRYVDTTAANLDKGIDSCGAVIFTYTNNTVWKRSCNPKAWASVGTGGSAAAIIPLELADQLDFTIARNKYSVYMAYAEGPTRDTVYGAFKEGDLHASWGKGFFQKTVNGTDWSTPTQIKMSPTDSVLCQSVDLAYSSGRVIACWASDLFTKVRFAYTDNGGATNWTVGGEVASQHGGEMSAYGKGIVVDGKIMFPVYETTADSSFVYSVESTDNGASFHMGVYLLRHLLAGTFPTSGGQVNETTWEICNPGAAVGSTIIMAVVRSETYQGHHYLVYSTNSGVTWTKYTVDWAFGETNFPVDFAFPAHLQYWNGNMYAYVGRRGVSGDYSIRVFTAPALQVYNNPAKWSKPVTIYRSLSYKDSNHDFGYPAAYITKENRRRVGFSDVDRNYEPGVGGSTINETINHIPAEGNNYFEAYNTTNQSITSGTETKVNTTFIALDAQGYYSSDSSKFYINQPGWYHFEAQAEFDTSSLGSYRQLKLEMVDAGQQYSTNPTAAYRIISKKTILPSTNLEDNYVHLSGDIYCYYGFEIRLTAMHDKGSALNIINTLPPAD